jgi:hypothetical protein
LKVPPKFDSLFAHEFVVQFDGDEWSGAAGFASVFIFYMIRAHLYGDALRIKNRLGLSSDKFRSKDRLILIGVH